MIIRTLIFIFLSFVLVGLNAFFVAAEFAIVKVRRTRLEELAGQGNSAARASIVCVDQLDEYLSATQLGITLVSLALGWIGEEAFYNLFLIIWPALAEVSSTPVHGLALGVSFFLITMLHVVLGELVPKSMAIQKAEKITLIVSGPLRFFYRVTKPLILAFTALANFVLRRVGYHGLEEPALSEEELKLVMRDSHEEGVISESEAQIINRAFEFSDKRASQIMISAEKVDFLSLERPFEENLRVTQMHMRTRFPLTQNGLGAIIGIVHLKDALPRLMNERSNSVFQSVARPVLYVDPGMRQDQLMKILKEKRAHLAVVRDSKTQRNLGVVTMEDILEDLVGEIRDEHGN